MEGKKTAHKKQKAFIKPPKSGKQRGKYHQNKKLHIPLYLNVKEQDKVKQKRKNVKLDKKQNKYKKKWFLETKRSLK